jgi:hypothetical protein
MCGQKMLRIILYPDKHRIFSVAQLLAYLSRLLAEMTRLFKKRHGV